eukprot:TRINITY_DN8988_c0_g2_i2.p2 TRINITY_DN8988_c0_g2~~TRINITY_DN8988_c0_g2_i2.p2  ORF type:complete len:160 (+),score=21.02 TRINITY_DN8988_c0_g2_i2:169-648(+)
MFSSIPKGGFQATLFEGFENEDTITIFELARLFKRLSGRQTGEPLKLARFAIEPEESKTIEYNEFREATIKMVSEKLENRIGKYHIFDSTKEKKIIKSIRKKIAQQIGFIGILFNFHRGGARNHKIIQICDPSATLKYEIQEKANRIHDINYVQGFERH